MSFNINRLRIAAAAVALTGASVVCTQANAASLAYAVGTDNWTFAGAGQVFVSGMVSNVFTKPAGSRLVITFSAECAVNAPAGNPNAWMDVDIVLLNAVTGAVVYTAAPTVGSADAFCSSTGTVGFGHWATHSVQALIPWNLAAGNYKAAVKARLNNGGTGGWLGERMLTVMQ
ncbi:MAG: hypothetical protein ABJD97_18310 [Betaproteobacteria bacterium]